MNRKWLQITLIIVGIAQIFFGAAFTFIPAKFGAMLGLPEAPQWTYWMFSMFGARCFGFAYGMFLAAHDPEQHTHWIIAMVGVQVVDWLGTLYYLTGGVVTMAQVSSAAYLPLIFIILLTVFFPRKQASTSETLAQPEV